MPRRTSPYCHPWQRPLFYTTTARRVRSSRYSGRTLRPRARTRFALGYHLAFLAGRRDLARRCRALGFRHVGKGVWYDSATDCAYAGVVPGEVW